MAKPKDEDSGKKPAKHVHPRDAKKQRQVFVENSAQTTQMQDEYAAFRGQLMGMDTPANARSRRRQRHFVEPEEDDVPVNTRRRSRRAGVAENEDEEGSKISMKYVILMSLMLLPGILEMIAMGGGLVSSVHGALHWLTDLRNIFIAVLSVGVPVLLYKLLPGRVVTLAFVALMVGTVTIPTAGVYMCSPIMMNYTHFGSNYSLRLPAGEILTQAVTPCIRRFPLAVYRFSAMSPQLSLVVAPGDVINVNITGSADSPLPYRLLIAQSGRSVKGRWHIISLLAKVPRRLAMRDIFTSMLEDSREDASYILRGKLAETPKSMRPMQDQLSSGKLMRPMMFDVFGIEAYT